MARSPIPVLLIVLDMPACARAEPPTMPVQAPYPAISPACDTQLPTKEPSVQLPVPHIRQSVRAVPDSQNNLCWAGSISMVSTYLGKPMAPCQVASLRAGTGFSCCRLPTKDNARMLETCNVGAPDEDVDAALTAIGLRFVRVPRPLSERELRQEISNGRPVLVKRATGNTKMVGTHAIREHHMLVVTGYDADRYHVLDPAPQGKALHLDYATLLRGDGRQLWRTSWTYLSFRPEACDPRFNPRCTCGR